MTDKFSIKRVGRRIDFIGDTQGKEGESRRIIVTNFPRGTTIPEIQGFFGHDTIEGITLFEYIAFIQFRRPQHHIDALLKNLSQFKNVKIVIKNYSSSPKNDPSRRRPRSPATRPIKNSLTRPPARVMRSRSRSRTPRREHTRREYRSPSPDLRRAILDASHRSRTPPRVRSNYSSSRSRNNYSPSRSRNGYSPSRSRRGYSPPRSSRHQSPSRYSRNYNDNISSRHSPPREDRHSRSSNSAEYSQSYAQSRQLVIRTEDGPMAGIIPQIPTPSSGSFSFGTNSIPFSTLPGCVSQPQPRPFLPPAIYTSAESKPSSNLGRIFSENQELQVAIVKEDPTLEQRPQKNFNHNGSNGVSQPDLPAEIELLLKLVIEQGSPCNLSLSQLNNLQKYFLSAIRRVEIETQMPQNGGETSLVLANGNDGSSDQPPERDTEAGKSNDGADLNGDGDENEIAKAIATKIRRLNA